MTIYRLITCDQRVGPGVICSRTLTAEDNQDPDALLREYGWSTTTGGAHYCQNHPTSPGLNSGGTS